jgi:hypothetical protein
MVKVCACAPAAAKTSKTAVVEKSDFMEGVLCEVGA